MMRHVAVRRVGQARFGHAMHEPLVLEPVRDELRDRDEREPVLRRELLELRRAAGRAVIIQDLADHAGGLEAGEPREVDGRLGVADALQDAAVTRAQRMHVARLAEIVGRPSPDRRRREWSSRGPSR